MNAGERSLVLPASGMMNVSFLTRYMMHDASSTQSCVPTHPKTHPHDENNPLWSSDFRSSITSPGCTTCFMPLSTARLITASVECTFDVTYLYVPLQLDLVDIDVVATREKEPSAYAHRVTSH